MKRVYILFILTAFLISCLKTDGIDVEKRVNSIYNVSNFNKLILKGSDSLRVTELKFLVDRFSIITQDSIVVQKSADVPALIFGYYEETSGDQLVFSVGLGFDGINKFNRYNVNINSVSRQTPVNDSDFFDSSNTYSIVIKGTYNSSEFTFKSSANIFQAYELDTVTLNNDDPVLVIETNLDVEQIFSSESDTLINPLSVSNRTQIEDNFTESLSVEFSKTESPFF